jgi:hypothetical protein
MKYVGDFSIARIGGATTATFGGGTEFVLFYSFINCFLFFYSNVEVILLLRS